MSHNSPQNDEASTRATLQLGSAFKSRSEFKTDGVRHHLTRLPDEDDLFSSGAAQSREDRRKSTTGDLLASMLGSATDTSASSLGLKRDNNNNNSSSSVDRTGAFIGLASPADLGSGSAFNLFNGSREAPESSHKAAKVLRHKSHPGTTSNSISSLQDLKLQSPFELFGAPDASESPHLPKSTKVRGLFGTPEEVFAPLPDVQRSKSVNDNNNSNSTPFPCPSLHRAHESMSRFPTPDRLSRGISPSGSWSPSDNMFRLSTSPRKGASTASSSSRHQSSDSFSSLRHAVLASTTSGTDAETTPQGPPALPRIPQSMPRFPTPTDQDTPSRLSRLTLFRYSSSNESHHDYVSACSPKTSSTSHSPVNPAPRGLGLTTMPSISSMRERSSQDETVQPASLRFRKRSLSLDNLTSSVRLNTLNLAEEYNDNADRTVLTPDPQTYHQSDAPEAPQQDQPLKADHDSPLPSPVPSFGGSAASQTQEAPTPDNLDAPLPGSQSSDCYGFPRASFTLQPSPGPNSPTLSVEPRVASPSGLSVSAFSDDTTNNNSSSRGRDGQRKSVFDLFTRSSRSRSKSQAGHGTRSAKSSRAPSPVDMMFAADTPEDDHRTRATRRASFSNKLSGLLSRSRKKSSHGAVTDDEYSSVPPTPALPAEFLSSGAHGSSSFFPVSPDVVSSPQTDSAKEDQPKRKLRSRASSIFNRRLTKASSSPNLNSAYSAGASSEPHGLGISFKTDADAPPVPSTSSSLLAVSAVSSLHIATAPIGRSFFGPRLPPKELPSLSTPDVSAEAGREDLKNGSAEPQASAPDQPHEKPLSASTTASESDFSATGSQPDERSALFDSTRYNTTATSFEPSPRGVDDSADQDNSCEVLREEDSEEGIRVWPPPSSQGDTSYQDDELAELYLQESPRRGADEQSLMDGGDGPSSRTGQSDTPDISSSFAAHPSDRPAKGAATSTAYSNAFALRGQGNNDSDSDSSSDGFGLPEGSDSEAGGSTDRSEGNSESEDDMPLAQRHPGALQAQKSLRERSRNSRKKLKNRTAKPESPKKAPNPFQFQSTLMSTKPLRKHAPHVGEPASKRASTPQPELEGHSLLPHTDESVRKRTMSRSKDSAGQNRDAALPLFVEQSILAFTEPESSAGLGSEAPVSGSAAHHLTGVMRSLTTARPARHGPQRPPPARSNTLPAPIITSNIGPSGSSSIDKITVYLRTMDGSCTVKNPTTAEGVVREVPLPDALSTIELWEVWTALGIERPLRSFERIAAVMESWDSTSKAVFMAKRALAPLGHIDQPISVNAILKPGKWSKRYLVVNDASSTVELYKSKQGQGEHTTLCSLSTFDSHLANSAHFASLKPPKTFLLVLKSIQPFAFFERKEDAMHVLSFGSAEQRDAAFALLRECRTKYMQAVEAQAAALPSPRTVEAGTSLLSFDLSPVTDNDDLPPKKSDAAFSSTGLVARSKSMLKSQGPEKLGRSRSNSKPPEPGRSRSMSRPPLPDLGRSLSVKGRPPMSTAEPPMPLKTDMGFTGGGLLSRGSGGDGSQSLGRSMTSHRHQQPGHSSDLHRSKTTSAPRW